MGVPLSLTASVSSHAPERIHRSSCRRPQGEYDGGAQREQRHIEVNAIREALKPSVHHFPRYRPGQGVCDKNQDRELRGKQSEDAHCGCSKDASDTDFPYSLLDLECDQPDETYKPNQDRQPGEDRHQVPNLPFLIVERTDVFVQEREVRRSIRDERLPRLIQKRHGVFYVCPVDADQEPLHLGGVTIHEGRLDRCVKRLGVEVLDDTGHDAERYTPEVQCFSDRAGFIGIPAELSDRCLVHENVDGLRVGPSDEDCFRAGRSKILTLQ